MEFGFRSVDPSISTNQPGSPFLSLAENGIQVSDLPPEVEVPKGEVLDALLDFWARKVN
jgi:hypothetical protein